MFSKCLPYECQPDFLQLAHHWPDRRGESWNLSRRKQQQGAPSLSDKLLEWNRGRHNRMWNWLCAGRTKGVCWQRYSRTIAATAASSSSNGNSKRCSMKIAIFLRLRSELLALLAEKNVDRGEGEEGSTGESQSAQCIHKYIYFVKFRIQFASRPSFTVNTKWWWTCPCNLPARLAAWLVVDWVWCGRVMWTMWERARIYQSRNEMDSNFIRNYSSDNSLHAST